MSGLNDSQVFIFAERFLLPWNRIKLSLMAFSF
ncbi:hypothetical protein CF149_02694 [Pseudomonas psychrophila]|nr:hypothetical protein CF149_02694 [Pseudomonas psychrophila]